MNVGIIGTGHVHLLRPDPMRETMAVPLVVDGRNMLEPAMASTGFTSLPTGRPPIRP